MLDEIFYSFRLWRLQSNQRRVRAKYDRDIKKAKKDKVDRNAIEELRYEGHFEDEDFDGAIRQLQTFHLIRLAERYLVLNLASSDWVQDEESLPYRYLTPEARTRLLNLVRTEQKEQFERWVRWVPVVTTLTGLLGVVAAILALLRN